MELFTNIQSWWELPSIAHFCSLFRAAFDLLDFDIEELEEAIITDGLDGSGSPLLVELLVRLLQGCLPGRTVTPSNVDSCLRKIFRQKNHESASASASSATRQDNLFPEGEFRHLPLRRKVEVLHSLCDFRLEADDVLDLLKNLETESLRIEPLGYDDRGSTYWYFYGTRLYREDNSLYHPFRRRPRGDKDDKKRKKRKRKREGGESPSRDSPTEGEEEEGDEEEPQISWQVECYTEDDWNKLAQRFASCDSRLEKSLHQTLKEDFLPEIPRLFEEKEKIQQKRMMEFAPRRSSGRVQKLKEKKEEEERKIAEEIVEEEKRRIQEDEKRRLEEAQREKKRMQEEDNEKKRLEEEEKNKVQNEEKRKLSEAKRRFHNKKERKRRKIQEDDASDSDVDDRVKSPDRLGNALDREEDILHEKNLIQGEPVPPLPISHQTPPSSPRPKQRKHKEKKIHHRKHHGHRKKLHGRNQSKNHSTLSLLESSKEDNLIVSDTSNKENNCLIETLSDGEENHEAPTNGGSRPQVYSGRKTNNSLSSMAFSLSPATVVPEPPTQMVTSPPNKRRVKSVHSLLQTADDLKTGMYKVLEHLRDHEDAWPFLDPVDDNFAPNYYAVIRRPMYISKMESRLDNEYYSSLSMFEADFKLMMDNCKLYNGPDSEYTHMAYTLEKVFAKLHSKYLEIDFSSDEEIYIDMSFQDSSKRRNKKRSSTEDNERESAPSSEKKKRGRKKKKVGRKPKEKHEESPVLEKSPRKFKGRRPKEKKGKEKSKVNKNLYKYPKDSMTEESSAYKEEEEKQEIDVKLNEDKEELQDEDEDDDDEDFDEGPLLVREDPYPEKEEDEDSTFDDFSPGLLDEEEEEEDKGNNESEYPVCNGYHSNKWKSDNYEISGWDKDYEDEDMLSPDRIVAADLRMGELADIVDDDDEEEGNTEEIIQKVYNHQSNKKKKELNKAKEKKQENKRKKLKNESAKKSKAKIKRKKSTDKGKRSKSSTNSISVEREGSENSANISATMDYSHSEVDSDRDGVLLYYSNNEEIEIEDETKNAKKKDSYSSEKQSELFGEIDDIEPDEHIDGKEIENGTQCNTSELQDQQKLKHGRKNSAIKEKKKHKHGEKHHHHHHHHKVKSKEGKHHHHHHKKKLKHASGKESPNKKVLKVEEVWDVSEEDPNLKEAREIERNKQVEVEQVENVDNASPCNPPPLQITLSDESHKPSPKKKKIRHRTKHDKHSKHEKKKEGKEKTKSTKKDSKKKSSKKKKKAAPTKMSAIDALSAATEQTLKDITFLLDDPSVPRFTGESPSRLEASPSHTVASQEFDDAALKIEADYRRKLKLESTDDKKVKKKKKRKPDEDQNKEENGPKKKKIKKEKSSPEVKDEKEKENIKTDNGSLDSLKEMFKDIKDGRIKPGAIIKSKDIAKKEGVVKKESKTATEGKPKSKQNPFGKINKQENSKLTTLIAKAKESRIGLVPNSEVGDSPKLSLGSIILFGDIGSGKHSSRDPNSADEEEKIEKLPPEKVEKWDSPWEKPDIKDESSLPPPSISIEEEEEKEEVEESCEPSPERPPEDIAPPMTPRAPEIKQEKATPNLSAWFRAFGGPKLTAAPRKRMEGRTDDEEEEDEDDLCEDEDRIVASDNCPDDNDEDEEIDVDDSKDLNKENESLMEKRVGMEDVKAPSSPEIILDKPPPAPLPVINNSPEPPPSPVKPPETPWIDKLEEKGEEEPIWKKNKTQEDEDPYKFEEEELDRAREEAKKLEVERQRKASVSSSGLSDPSPLNIDSDRSPAAFSSEGERSPLTKSPAIKSPAIKSPVTPGFGSKQISPATEKSPTVPAYSPRYDPGLGKAFPTYDGDKSKYQNNGSLKVSFYQDMSDKSNQDKTDANKCLEQKAKESPIYSPTVPYVSPFYSNKDASLCKQKSPGRYGNFYSSTLDAPLDKPKTPVYYSASAPSTPSDMPPSSTPLPEDKPKNQYNYYNYDPTKPLTDQYKSTGSNAAKPFYGTNDTSVKNVEQSPVGQRTPLHANMTSPVSLGLNASKNPIVPDKVELQPPKKRQMLERMSHQQASDGASSHPCNPPLSSTWNNKSDEMNVERNIAVNNRTQYQQPPLPANLANLSQIVSRIPEPETNYPVPEKELRLAQDESLHANPPLQVVSKTVQQPSLHYGSSGSLTQPSPDLQPLLTNRSNDPSRSADPDHPSLPDIPKNPVLSHQQNLSHFQPQPTLSPSHLLGKQISPASLTQPHQALSHLPPPAAHQKNLEVERPGSRNTSLSHPDDKPHGYLQKTMWTSSLPQSIASSLSSSLSSLVSTATMASFALAGQKGFGSLSSEHLAQLGMDRAALASLANRSSQNGSNPFSHDLVPRTTQNSSTNSVGMSNQCFTSSGGSHGRSSSSGSSSNTPNTTSSSTMNNFELGLARSYASMMSATQSSPLLVRSDGALQRSLPGSSSPFLPQSPGLGAALGMSAGSSRTPTPAHQQPLPQSNFPSITRDPRDPISQSHPSLQIPSLNSLSNSQSPALSHLNAASLSYSGRDSLTLMNQGGRAPPLVGTPSGLVDPTQQIYQQYLQRHQLAAQEELLFRSGAHSQIAAHQSMMLQQGLMSAAAAGYPSGYPHSLGLRSGTYQGMNRPWI